MSSGVMMLNLALPDMIGLGCCEKRIVVNDETKNRNKNLFFIIAKFCKIDCIKIILRQNIIRIKEINLSC
jgi:hypothetical protein